MALVAGQILNNRYRIVQLLGQGGFGAVYKAWDMNMKAACAVKENFDITPAAQSQFEREATLLFGLRHHNLPRVYDLFLIANQGQYLVMDFIEGQNLQDMLDRGGPGRSPGAPLVEGQALAWIGQVAEALGYMHRQNPPVIHRDIKPANIVINPEGEAVLVDFGIAKAYDPRFKTTQGARAVTPGYSPHEQYGQGTTDARSDVYSLGATLYTLLTGAVPVESIQRMLRDPLPPPRQLNPAISAPANTAILKAMSNDPDQRFTDGGAFQAALHGAARPGAVQLTPTQVVHASAQTLPVPAASRQPRRGLLLGGAMLAMLILIGGIWAWNAFTRNSPDQSLQGTATAEKAAMQATLAALALPGQTSAASTASQLAQDATLTIAPPAGTGDQPVAPTTQDTPTPELGIGSTMVSDKDGMVMMYVPEGSFLMGSKPDDPGAQGDEQPQHDVFLDAFWIDQTEVTNAMYGKCVGDGACKPPSEKSSYPQSAYYDDPQYADYPVIDVSWNDADAYCRWVGRRLPTEAQWEKAARGDDGRLYPWGNQTPSCDLGNIYNHATSNYCEGGNTEVGSYPKGASPYGALDMAGNVWEWVSDWYDSSYYSNSPASNPTGPERGSARAVRGGRNALNSYYLRVADRYFYDSSGRYGHVGFRCAAPPAPAAPTATQTPEPSGLGIGSSMVSEKDGMTLMYVPEGSFLMGSNQGGNSDEIPQRTVTLDAFWIDQTEVTNAQYALCVADGACQIPPELGSAKRSAYYNDTQYADFPVIWVSRNDASAYCTWAGRRLPTEAEWEKAARGENGQTYPWGNQTPTCQLANFYNCKGDTTAAGSYPAGASPYGALDMAGNVFEMVQDWYDNTYYQVSPTLNPTGPPSGTYRAVHSGSWDNNMTDVRAANRGPDNALNRYNFGFRCAASPGQVSAAPSAGTGDRPVAPTGTPTPQDTPTSGLGIGSTMLWEKDGMTLMYVPAGEFLMGSTEKESKYYNERPQHMVYLDAFWIDQTEVTTSYIAGVCPPGNARRPQERILEPIKTTSRILNLPSIQLFSSPGKAPAPIAPGQVAGCQRRRNGRKPPGVLMGTLTLGETNTQPVSWPVGAALAAVEAIPGQSAAPRMAQARTAHSI